MADFSSDATTDPPIVCTLRATDVPDRLDEWRTVLGGDIVARNAIDGGVRLTLSADADVAEIARLAASEHDCCQFLSFRLTIDRAGTALEVTAPVDGVDVVHGLFGAPAA